MTTHEPLVLDDATARNILTHFPSHHFPVKHQLVGHPLLEIPRLAALSEALPAAFVEYNSGRLSVSQDPRLTPGNGLSATDTIRKIHECDSWVALKYVEHDPDYRALLLRCVQQLMTLCEQRAPGTHQMEGYVFISSPGAVTPYHFDDEHNFLLQVAGTKDVHTWDGTDPEIVNHRDFERYYAGAHRNIEFRDELKSKQRTFRLEPGHGVYIPAHAPHWVRNGGRPSVSLSVTFRSNALRKEAAVHWLNAKMRAKGLRPRPYGASKAADRVKFFAARAIRRIQSWR